MMARDGTKRTLLGGKVAMKSAAAGGSMARMYLATARETVTVMATVSVPVI